MYIYTPERAKCDNNRICKEGDKPLIPFKQHKSNSIYEKLKANVWNNCDIEQLEIVLKQLLSKYLPAEDVCYYLLQYIKHMRYNTKDSYMQVIQIVQDKVKQFKFANGTKEYQRKNLEQFAIKENLKEFGWSIEPPTKKSIARMKYNQNKYEGEVQSRLKRLASSFAYKK